MCQPTAGDGQRGDRTQRMQDVRHAARVLALRTHEYVQTVARLESLHEAHIRAVGVLRRGEATGQVLTAGELARELALSPAAVTDLLDRMERAGHVTRLRSSTDARRVEVRAAESAHQTSEAMFGPLVEAYERVLAGRSTRDIALVTEVLTQLADVTRTTAGQLRDAPVQARPATTTEGNQP